MSNPVNFLFHVKRLVYIKVYRFFLAKIPLLHSLLVSLLTLERVVRFLRPKRGSLGPYGGFLYYIPTLY